MKATTIVEHQAGVCFRSAQRCIKCGLDLLHSSDKETYEENELVFEIYDGSIRMGVKKFITPEENHRKISCTTFYDY